MTETQELKACWCCSAPALLERDGDHHGEWFNLGCSRHWEAVPDRAEACPAGRIWYTADPSEMNAAITAWNTRPREAELEAALEEAKGALEVFIADEVDYMTRNKLGDPEKQHRVILGRSALTRIRAAKGGE